MAEAAGRPAKPRTRRCGVVPEEQQRAVALSYGYLPQLLPVLDVT